MRTLIVLLMALPPIPASRPRETRATGEVRSVQGFNYQSLFPASGREHASGYLRSRLSKIHGRVRRNPIISFSGAAVNSLGSTIKPARDACRFADGAIQSDFRMKILARDALHKFGQTHEHLDSSVVRQAGVRNTKITRMALLGAGEAWLLEAS